MSAFRIGGVYRQRNGQVVRLGKFDFSDLERHYFSVHTLDNRGEPKGYNGARFIDGSYFGDPSHKESLLPGELHLKDGQWVAMANGCGVGLPVAAPAPSAPTTKPKREPLDWAKLKRFDAFKDFHVRSGGYKSEEDAAAAERSVFQRSPDLQPTGHQVNPAFGTAHR